MEVKEIELALVKCFPGIPVRLIRGTELDRVCSREGTIDRVAGRCSRENTNLKWIAFRVLSFGPLGNFYRYNLWAAGMSEPAEANIIVVFHDRCSLFSTNKL